MTSKRTTLTYRFFAYCTAVLSAVYLILAIPLPSTPVPPVSETSLTHPFAWNQDAKWDSLEGQYSLDRLMAQEVVEANVKRGMDGLKSDLRSIEGRELEASSPVFVQLEKSFFSLAPLVAAYPASLPDYLQASSDIRTQVKQQSERWNLNDRPIRETLYRLLYGTRSAVEEVMLQVSHDQPISSLLAGVDEPSVTPSALLLGVTVHSGDILVSRGGAPTSALIARGNDFPGNFSHVALAYVDSASSRLSIIESHIERGVIISTPEEYLDDTKLRVMVLRPRFDLPEVKQDLFLPHRASSFMLRSVLQRHIPYDFSMDYADSSKLFCSEVASYAYRAFGIRLWMGMSHISSRGLRSWLADFGVTHFQTEEPSDLEYDPQLRVVAEWRDIETLRKDHIDNAVTEAMLEGAEEGEQLDYDWYMLPFARAMKAYSWILNQFGSAGPVPEGMNATAALKNRYYSDRHARIVSALQKDAVRFKDTRGIQPPYWELLRMARYRLKEETNKSIQ